MKKVRSKGLEGSHEIRWLADLTGNSPLKAINLSFNDGAKQIVDPPKWR